MLALIEYEAQLCPCGCGHLYDDTTSDWETGPEFVVSRTTCRARAALVAEQRAYAERNPDSDSRSRLWGTVMRKG